MDQKQAPEGSEPREVGSQQKSCKATPQAPGIASRACTPPRGWDNLLIYTYYVKVILLIIFVFYTIMQVLMIIGGKI